ncbi:MAG: sigma 54-interacting transcriptional regulator [Thermodesulfobacteriota bacterium]
MDELPERENGPGQALTEDKYEVMFRKSGAASVVIAPDMTIVMANREFEKLSGYSRAEIEHRMKWTQFMAPEYLEMMQGYHRARRTPGGKAPSEYECKVITRKGDVRDILIKVAMLPGMEQSLASFMDITELVRAERRARESVNRLVEVLEATESFIYTCGADHRVRFANQALIRHLGSDPTGLPCHEALFGREETCPWCWRNAAPGPTEFFNPADGRWYHVIVSPVTDGTTGEAGIQAMLVDITVRKRKEQELAESTRKLERENIRLRSGMAFRYRFQGLVGKSGAMQKVYDDILRAAASDANAVVYGESGTGKELAARAIHDLSDRKDGPFVVVHCGAIPENLMESEFFGYRKGAFTGAAMDTHGYLDLADGGTLFLDEIGEIGPAMQVKLLRAVEGGGFTPLGGGERKIPDLRIIAATNRDLAGLVRAGTMRQDFYYRIHIVPVHMPPLRARLEDIPLLAEHFRERFGEGGKKVPPLPVSLMEALARYDWPGNVRELQNTLHRFLSLGRLELGGALQDLAAAEEESVPEIREGEGLAAAMAAFEAGQIRRALSRNQWSRSRTAGYLGINRKTLFKKMKEYGIE